MCEGVNYCAHLCFIITLDTVLISNKVDHQSKRAAAYELRYEYHSGIILYSFFIHTSTFSHFIAILFSY